jgi:hypothetical protein
MEPTINDIKRMIEESEEAMNEYKPINGVIIYPDGTHEERLFKQLDDYKDAIGGWITAVNLYDYNGMQIACAYVDDEGLLKELSLNPMAGALSFLFGNTPHLMGNAVLVGRVDDEGYNTDLPEFIVTLIKNISAKQDENA